MIWLLVALLAIAALAPLAIALDSRTKARGPRDPAVALHRAQLAELDRDLAEGRILPAEHGTAMLEVQRRMLAAAAEPGAEAAPGSRAPLFAVMILVPVAALALYGLGGQPGMPSVAATSQQARLAEEAILVARLREQLAGTDPASDRARQGYVLLGTVEEARGNDAAAAAAWRTALEGRFDAGLAARAGEAAVRAEGRVSESTAALFRRALAATPDAPWRAAVEQRLQQAGVR